MKMVEAVVYDGAQITSPINRSNPKWGGGMSSTYKRGRKNIGGDQL